MLPGSRARIRSLRIDLPIQCGHQLESHPLAVSAWVHGRSPESNVIRRWRATYNRLITVPRGTANAFDNSS